MEAYKQFCRDFVDCILYSSMPLFLLCFAGALVIMGIRIYKYMQEDD